MEQGAMIVTVYLAWAVGLKCAELLVGLLGFGFERS